MKIGSAKEQEDIGVEARWANTNLKIQLEEAKRREEVLKNHLDEKEKTCEHLEMEVVGLKKKIEKSNVHVKFTNSSVILDEILDSQRPTLDKSGLGYNKAKEKSEVGTWSPDSQSKLLNDKR